MEDSELLLKIFDLTREVGVPKFLEVLASLMTEESETQRELGKLTASEHYERMGRIIHGLWNKSIRECMDRPASDN